MRIGIDDATLRKLTAVANRAGKSAHDLVMDMVFAVAQHEPDPQSSKPTKCLCPVCDEYPLSRGLCSRHYQRMKYFVARGLLNEGWMVRNGRAMHTKSCPNNKMEIETVETLPGEIPDHGRDTEWMWDWPDAFRLKEKLLALRKGPPTDMMNHIKEEHSRRQAKARAETLKKTDALTEALDRSWEIAFPNQGLRPLPTDPFANMGNPPAPGDEGK